MKEELIGFVHFDKPGTKNNRLEVLVVKEKAVKVLRNKFIKIIDSFNNKKNYIGRVLEGPFFQPEEVSRESALAQVAILHGDEFPIPPNFYATFIIDIVGIIEDTRIVPTGSRPAPQSKVINMSDEELNTVLSLKDGDLLIGNLAGYDNIHVKFNSKKISILPRNIGIFGTVGSGKTNTAQVLIEELVEQGWAVIVLDVEGEYTMMNLPNSIEHEIKDLERFNIAVEGVKNFSVFKLCNQDATLENADEITIRTDQIDGYVLAEILDTTEPQTATLLAIIDSLKKTKRYTEGEERNILTPGRRTTGYTLNDILNVLKEIEISPEKLNKYGVRKGSILPLKRKLESLKRSGAFDDPHAESIDPNRLMEQGKLTVFDLSYTGDYEKNLLTAQLLNRIFLAKLRDKHKKLPPTMIIIEEAHTFISREHKDKMYETMRMLKEIARRGRKRWLSLCFISQQPSHLPNEIFELANTRIVHNIRSSKNLDILRNSSGDVSEELWDSVPNLDVGQAIVNGPQFRNSLVIKARYCKTKRHRLED